MSILSQPYSRANPLFRKLLLSLNLVLPCSNSHLLYGVQYLVDFLTMIMPTACTLSKVMIIMISKLGILQIELSTTEFAWNQRRQVRKSCYSSAFQPSIVIVVLVGLYLTERKRGYKKSMRTTTVSKLPIEIVTALLKKREIYIIRLDVYF